MCPKKGNKSDEKTTGHGLCGPAEDIRFLQLRGV